MPPLARITTITAPHLAAASTRWRALALSITLLATASAMAATPPPSPAQARYQQERAACLNGQSSQDRATCLREASAALVEARHGGMDNSSANLVDNQRKRCDRLHGDERSACITRMQGAGTTSGSVAGGGIYRELVTPVAAASAPAKP